MPGHAELGEARTDQPEMEKGRSRAGAAVEHEGQRPRRVIVVPGVLSAEVLAT